MIKKWKVTAEINLDAGKIKTVEVEANTELKAIIFAEKKLKNSGAFYVSIVKAEQII